MQAISTCDSQNSIRLAASQKMLGAAQVEAPAASKAHAAYWPKATQLNNEVVQRYFEKVTRRVIQIFKPRVIALFKDLKGSDTD